MSPHYLDLWQVDDPPAGFADRVAATAMGEKRRVTRRAAFGLAAAACTALAGWKLDSVIHSHALTAKIRTEVQLGPGMIAILEQGARLLWNRAGARQERGDVSYRVSPLGTLQIETPLGNLMGRGTCCRIKLAELAGQSAALFVSVTQGDLDVSHPTQHAVLHRGEYARVTTLAIETEADDTSGVIARELDLLPPPRRLPALEPEKRDESPAPPPPTKRAPERSSHPLLTAGGSPSAQPSLPPADVGARRVIVPSCFCDRGDSLCACFH